MTAIETTQSSRWLRAAPYAVAVLAFLLYAGGMNSFVLPAVYDNIVYYQSAKSLAAGEGYRFASSFVGDWPPAFALALAVPFALGLESVITAKLAVLLCVGLGLCFTYRLLKQEGRPHAWLIVGVFTALPASMMMGTRVVAEWPYIAASFACLLVLRQLGESRRLSHALAAGLLLGTAALTRYVGVFLGVAFIAQAIGAFRGAKRGARLRSTMPEVVASVVGGSVFCVWIAVLSVQLVGGQGGAIADNMEPHVYGHFHLDGVLRAVGHLLFQWDTVVGKLGLTGLLALAVGIVPAMLCLVGVAARVRRLAPCDWYVAAYLAFLCVYERGEVKILTRYLMPVAPFLISYLFEGLLLLSRAVARRRGTPVAWALPALATAWILVAVAVDGIVIFRGNLSRTHGGLCALASRSPESFYRGYWQGLYRACRAVAESGDRRPVALAGTQDWKYVMLFSEREPVSIEEVDRARFVIVRMPTELPPNVKARMRPVAIGPSGEVSLYERTPEHS